MLSKFKNLEELKAKIDDITINGDRCSRLLIFVPTKEELDEC